MRRGGEACGRGAGKGCGYYTYSTRCTHHPLVELLDELRRPRVMLRHPYMELVRKRRWVEPHGCPRDLRGYIDEICHSLLRLLGEHVLQDETEGSVLEGSDPMPVDDLVGGDGGLQHGPKVIGAVGEMGIHRYTPVRWVRLVHPHDRCLGGHRSPQLLLTRWRAKVVRSLAGHPRGGKLGGALGLREEVRVRDGVAFLRAAHEGDHRLGSVDDRTEVGGVRGLGAGLGSHVVDVEPHTQRRDEAAQRTLDGAALVLAREPVVRDEAVRSAREQRPRLHGRAVTPPPQHVLCGALLEDVA